MDANGEQQIDAISRGAAAEADVIGEQQLCTESCLAPDYSHRRTRGEVAVIVYMFISFAQMDITSISNDVLMESWLLLNRSSFYLN